jgi:homoserine O-acetyltransferase
MCFFAWSESKTGEREAYSVFELGDFVLKEGATLRGAKLAYKTWGTMNEDRSNAIVYPTWFAGRHWENDWLIGPGMGLDPCKYFIIVPNMLGNGLSTSPSNCPPPYNKARFPKVHSLLNLCFFFFLRLYDC